ncbi:hypothetical protein NONI108955_44680 [Nocardia ninae]|uniref:DUF8176 domain-containing protein n=1 Tax=Nocardia ninae NBRC 108245 TaxID=1210091 RepID=A0A511MUN4_9NOCA|nr:hypothetical protein [Nocardia ninae]GEM44292.1 hypothetical protein NN4_88110 [Nocardia ninae NBRC 108245]
MRSRDTPDDKDPFSWLQEPRSTPQLHIIPGPGPGDELEAPESPPREGRWLVALPDTSDTADTGVYPPWWAALRHRLPGGAWAALAVTVAAILTGAVVVAAIDSGETGEAVGATAAPPSATSTAEGACTGLSGTVVTDRDGDTTTVAGLIASFQAAYYIHRSAEAALRLLAPESGIAAEGLAAGIASIPLGTTHCVSITPISASTANVHVSEVHPDRTRTDYLQLVNTRPGEAGALLISNIQEQG